jgi:hypothetical protein
MSAPGHCPVCHAPAPTSGWCHSCLTMWHQNVAPVHKKRRFPRDDGEERVRVLAERAALGLPLFAGVRSDRPGTPPLPEPPDSP